MENDVLDNWAFYTSARDIFSSHSVIFLGALCLLFSRSVIYSLWTRYVPLANGPYGEQEQVSVLRLTWDKSVKSLSLPLSHSLFFSPLTNRSNIYRSLGHVERYISAKVTFIYFPANIYFPRVVFFFVYLFLTSSYFTKIYPTLP